MVFHQFLRVLGPVGWVRGLDGHGPQVPEEEREERRRILAQKAEERHDVRALVRLIARCTLPVSMKKEGQQWPSLRHLMGNIL